MSAEALVGFHAASLLDEPDSPSAQANAIVGAYLNEIGLSFGAIEYLTQALPRSMKWLTFADADANGIYVDRWAPDGPQGQRQAQPRQPKTWPLGEWVQIFSRAEFVDARNLAASFRATFPGTRVFRFDNGWFVVAIGPYEPGTALSWP